MDKDGDLHDDEDEDEDKYWRWGKKGEEEACMVEKDITDDETRNLFDKIDDFFEIN